MKNRILTGPISRLLPQIFYMPDTGGGAGGGGAPAGGAPAGGDGGAGGDPGAGGGGDGDPNAGILDFTPPPMDDLKGDLTGGDPKKPIVKKDDPKPAPKGGEPKPKPAAPDPFDDPETPVAKLREGYKATKGELEKANTELAEMKKRLEAGDPRIADAQRERDAIKADLEKERERIKGLEEENYMRNPEVTKEVTELDRSYREEADNFFDLMPALNHSNVGSLIVEFDKLPRGTPEYAAALDAFRAKVNGILGGTDETKVDGLAQALQFIQKAHGSAVKRTALVKSIRETAGQRHFDAINGGYTRAKKSIDAGIEAGFTVAPEMKDPYVPNVIVAGIDEVLGPEKAAAHDKNIKEFVSLVFAGHPPRRDADYSGMSPEQIRESRAKEADQVRKAREIAPQVMTANLRLARRVPYLLMKLKAQEEALAKYAAAEPGDPDAGGGGGGGEGYDNLAEFQAPDPHALKLG